MGELEKKMSGCSISEWRRLATQIYDEIIIKLQQYVIVFYAPLLDRYDIMGGET